MRCGSYSLDEGQNAGMIDYRGTATKVLGLLTTTKVLLGRVKAETYLELTRMP